VHSHNISDALGTLCLIVCNQECLTPETVNLKGQITQRKLYVYAKFSLLQMFLGKYILVDSNSVNIWQMVEHQNQFFSVEHTFIRPILCMNPCFKCICSIFIS